MQKYIQLLSTVIFNGLSFNLIFVIGRSLLLKVIITFLITHSVNRLFLGTNPSSSQCEHEGSIRVCTYTATSGGRGSKCCQSASVTGSDMTKTLNMTLTQS